MKVKKCISQQEYDSLLGRFVELLNILMVNSLIWQSQKETSHSDSLMLESILEELEISSA